MLRRANSITDSMDLWIQVPQIVSHWSKFYNGFAGILFFTLFGQIVYKYASGNLFMTEVVEVGLVSYPFPNPDWACLNELLTTTEFSKPSVE